MDHPTCDWPGCDAPIPPRTGRRGRPASRCTEHRGMSRKCSVEGCWRPHRAKGFCASHYNERFHPDRHARKRSVACSVCGKPCEKIASSGHIRRPVCGYRCRYQLTYGRDIADGRELVGPVARRTGPEGKAAPRESSLPGPKARFIAGSCRWCGAGYTYDLRNGGATARYCSARCTRSAGRARHREMRGQFAISRKRRLAIYERDGWICQLCFEPVDRNAHYMDNWAPSLDHIIPQSMQLVPDHSDGALRLSHRWCNAVRGNDKYYTADDLLPA